MKKLFALLFASFMFFCCEQKSEKNGSHFKELSDSITDNFLAWRPQTGVYLGFHEFDGKLTDYSKTSIDKELARLKEDDKRLSGMDTASLSAEEFYDLRILQHAIKTEIFYIEDLNVYTTNPMTYAGTIDANAYVKRDFGPIEERVKSIIALENQAPDVFKNAKANLLDTLAKPYVETAIQIARGSASFLGGDLIKALKDVKNDSLMAAFRTANKTAIDAINDYADYLEKEKLPKSNNRYAIGREKYQKMLAVNEGITLTPERILEIGLNELKKEQDSFNAAAKIINPNKKPVEVYNDLQNEHPTAANLIADTRKTLESIRKYLLDKKIVSLPSEDRVRVEETPQYLREVSTASLDAPGPFEAKATEGYYYITPVDPKWTGKQQEDWLRQFNYFSNDVVTIHEAYPGHYMQFQHLKASPATRIEKIFMSYAYVEGWAHYAEKMMLDDGFGNNGDPIRAAKYRIAQSGEALLRLCRLCVSVKTHCQGMSVDEATKFFMDNWYQGDKPSRQEALRGTFDPGYLYYTMGKLQLLKLRADYQKQEGANFSQQKFHDLVLGSGMPPIRLLREKLLKDKAIWGDIL